MKKQGIYIKSESDGPLDEIFDKFVSNKNKIFLNRDVLRHTYVPDVLPHREEQSKRIAQILGPALRKETPSNIFCYGKTGTGKTIVVKYVLNYLKEKCQNLDIQVPLTHIINCRIIDTNYRVLASLCKSVGEDVPFTGLPTDEVYNRFKVKLDEKEQIMIIVLDEVDELVKKKDFNKVNDILYDLTRMNAELVNTRVSIIGISNDLTFKDYLEPRVISGLSQEECLFESYSASQLQDILRQRAEIGYYENVLEDGVIPRVAAFAAREHGDARRALDLLLKAGEIAERSGAKKVLERHVDEAQFAIESSLIKSAISKLPIQSKLILYSIYKIEKLKVKMEINTGEVYDVYQQFCNYMKLEALSQRRVSDLITDLDMQGLINASIINRGRYGRTKKIKLNIKKSLIVELIENNERFSLLSDVELTEKIKKH
ncbi:MAG: ORC1-type DNA replication protein [Candidatus Helarchaeota archaeon]